MRYSAASVRVTIDGNPIPIVTAFEYSGPCIGEIPSYDARASLEATGYTIQGCALFWRSRYWQRRAMWRRRMNNRREETR
jgi:hypothetical protein